MTNPPQEYVLATPTHVLPPHWLPQAGHVPLNATDWSTELASLKPVWSLRSEAESNPQLKQWIPYAVLRRADGAIAAYPRQGREARLHGLWSVGVGGHVNPTDAPEHFSGGTAWAHVLEQALRRELTEEYPGTAAAPATFLGLVHEHLTPVGQVHIGAVYRVDVSDDPGPHGPELDGLQWLPAGVLGTRAWPPERFELWSRLALPLLLNPPTP